MIYLAIRPKMYKRGLMMTLMLMNCILGQSYRTIKSQTHHDFKDCFYNSAILLSSFAGIPRIHFVSNRSKAGVKGFSDPPDINHVYGVRGALSDCN